MIQSEKLSSVVFGQIQTKAVWGEHKKSKQMPYIHSIGVSAPNFQADNDFVKEMVLSNSASYWNDKVNELAEEIDAFFDASGSKKRLMREHDYSPKRHILEAAHQCLSGMSVYQQNKLSSVIYCGIDRGLFEPATASIIAHQLGLDDIRAFDISDACLGWVTACQTATAFASEEKPLSLIISAEFPWDRPGVVYPRSLTIRSRYELSWKLSALTLGEAATATLIDAHRGTGKIKTQSHNQHHELCIAPAREPDRFINWTGSPELVEDACFIANGPLLARYGFKPSLDVINALIDDIGSPDIVVPHAFSQSVPARLSRHANLEKRLYNCFCDTGNLASSSLPYSLWMLRQERDVFHQKIFGCVASAGMKFAAFQVHFLPEHAC